MATERSLTLLSSCAMKSGLIMTKRPRYLTWVATLVSVISVSHTERELTIFDHTNCI